MLTKFYRQLLFFSLFKRHEEAVKIIKEATKLSCNLLVDTLIICYYFLYTAGQESNSPDFSPPEQRAIQLIPLLEEIVQRTKFQKFLSFDSKRDRILAFYREYFRGIEWNMPDLECLFGEMDVTKSNEANILNTMKLSMAFPSRIKFESPDLESNLQSEYIIEKV